MLEETDEAPLFSAPMATPENAGDRGEYTSGHVEAFDLEEALSDGPVVLAFFPGVYSRTCTEELCQFRDWMAGLEAIDASVYGVSADTPWSQLAFVDEYDLAYPLLSGFNNDVIEAYGLRRDEGLLAGLSNRAVIVVAPDGTVAYRWIVHEPQVFPDLDAVESAVSSART